MRPTCTTSRPPDGHAPSRAFGSRASSARRADTRVPRPRWPDACSKPSSGSHPLLVSGMVGAGRARPAPLLVSVLLTGPQGGSLPLGGGLVDGLAIEVDDDAVDFACGPERDVLVEHVVEDRVRVALEGVAPAAAARAFETERLGFGEGVMGEQAAVPVAVLIDAADDVRLALASLSWRCGGLAW